MVLSIDLAVEHDGWAAGVGTPDAIQGLAGRAVAATLAAVVEHVGPVPDAAEVSLLLCGDDAIRDLNRRWRGLDKATNVLSFPAAAPARRVTLGDVAVAFETAAREARERGVSLADHLTHLLVHGVLHLVGLDHEEEGEAERMEALEGAILADLGVASPFQDPLAEAVAGEVAS